MSKKIQPISPLVDQFSRTISYLRLSLTDRCNLNCMYCMPVDDENKGAYVKTGKFLAHEDLLSYEELLRVVTLAVSLGMSKIRLTGGEPLVRKDVISFIEKLSEIDGLEQVRLTTNGVLLHDYAEKLYAAGVKHINVSLDTLHKDKFAKITGRDHFDKVWAGLMLAKEIGFKIKLNVVAIKNFNDDEFLDFGRLALAQPFQVRFIEFMPVGENSIWEKDQFIEADKIKEMISSLGELTPFKRKYSEGPARMFDLESSDGKQGTVGFISPISHHFCDKCNRLRLTSEGRLRSCLLTDNETDLKELLRNNCSDEELVAQIRLNILNKPKRHHLAEGDEDSTQHNCAGRMSRIGG